MHYMRLRRYGATGAPDPLRRGADDDAIEHIAANSVVDKQTGCWRWQGSTSWGYGVISINGRRWRIHRLSYEHFVAEIPEGLVLDHVYDRGCRHRDCWNPAHLEPVTIRINTIRGVVASA